MTTGIIKKIRMDWNGRPYHSLDFMLRERFGGKVYKVTLNGGMTCPNRDGTISRGGCIFCSAGGSGDFAADAALSVTKQIDSQIAILAKKDRFTGISPIFRHIQIPMHRFPICGRFLPKHSRTRLSVRCPSEQGRTACRRM